MAISSEERDNLPRWRPGKAGFFETYDLRWVEAREKTAGWLRFGPLQEARIEREIFYFSVGPTALFQSGSHGKIEADGHRMEWDLRLEGPSRSLRHLPAPFYLLPYPPTKLLAPRLSCRVSGTVSIDNRQQNLVSVPAHQAHFWGSAHPPFWAWGHCNSFREDPGAVFEGLSSVLSLAGKVQPVTLLHLTFGGKDYSFLAPWHWLRNKSRYDLSHWHFEAEGKGIRLIGKLRADPGKMAGLKYRDPDLSERFCHHTEAADLQIELFRDKERIGTLTAGQTAAFEMATGRPDPRVTFFS